MEDTDRLVNKQMVGICGNNISVLKPEREMTKQEALVHAAWIVALTDEEDQFNEILDSIREL